MALILTFSLLKVSAQPITDTLQLAKDSIALNIDSIASIAAKNIDKLTIVDTIRNPTLLRKYFFANEKITGIKFYTIEKEFDRAVPGVKQIITRPEPKHTWKFWVLISMLFFIGTIRLLNIKRFDNILSSVYYLNFNETIWKEKGTNYLLTAIELFLVFIATLALFAVSYIQEKRIFIQSDFFQLFLYLLVIIFGVYVIKFSILFIVSSILKLNKLAKMYVYNTLVINDILSIALIPTLLVYIYANNMQIREFAAIFSLLLIIGAVVFRVVKNLLMANSVSTYPNIYLIVYLCAFEILPWLIIFKILFKALQI